METGNPPAQFAPNQNEFRYVFFTPPAVFEATVAFYQQGLGLPLKGGFGDASSPMQGAYIQAAAGVIEILTDRAGSELKNSVMAAGESPRPATGGWVLIEVDHVDRAYEHAARQGVKIHQDLVNWPWAFRDFKAEDPCGNLVCLFSRLAG